MVMTPGCVAVVDRAPYRRYRSTVRVRGTEELFTGLPEGVRFGQFHVVYKVSPGDLSIFQ